MKPGDLRQLTQEELEARIRQLQDQAFSLRTRHATGQLENSAGLKTTRRDLARAITVRHERERAQ
jgi:large subunit ribosomal protein L29